MSRVIGNRSRSFNDDIEKHPLTTKHEREDIKFNGPKKRNGKVNLIFSLLCIISLIGTTINLISFNKNQAEMSNSQRFKLEHDALDDKLSEDEERSLSFVRNILNFFRLKKNDEVSTNDFNLFDVDSVSDTDELWRFNDNRLTSEISASEVTNEMVVDEDIDPQLDLKEILSINSIVILSDDAYSLKQKKLEEILLLKLDIIPEPKVVNLSKHPHYEDIFYYLKSYIDHEYSPKLVNNKYTIKDDLEFNNNVDDDIDLNKNGDIDENEDDDIPRLFIGGLPIGNYNDVFEKFTNDELIDYLRTIGEGLITVS